ncbi:MAG: cation:proton antiporter [Verrucomicrobiae bacterium]|nr:cation:proton antiporter [Verrucomicrobiae bacterium]
MEERLLYFSAVLLAGIFAQWLAWRLKLPSILLLLAFGFLGGHFYDTSRIIEDQTLFAIVSMSVAIIMLEGGLSLKFRELKEAGMTVLRLVSLGALVTWLLSTVAAHYLAGFTWQVSLLIGAILVVTGPTVIGPLLRAVKPKKPIGTILKWEGIVIDPVGAVLAVLVFGALFAGGEGHHSSVPLAVGRTLLVGGGLGWGTAYLLTYVLRNHWVPDFLQSVVILVLALSLFALSNHLQHESGLLTVTVLGVVLANQHAAKVRHIIEFKENLRTLLISSLFIVLGGRIGFDDLAMVWREALGFLLVLIVIVRPISVFLSILGSKLHWREKLYLSLMAPRGIVAAAVSAIFALELAETGGAFAAEAARIVPVAYTVIVGTVAFYGLLAAPLANRLQLAVKNPQGVLFAGIRPWSIEAARALQRAGFRALMVDSNYQATRAARMAGVAAVNANILSDYVTEEVDLSGIGRLFAITPNDNVNAMACMAFGHSLGRSNVYQIAPSTGSEGSHGVSSELTGRLLFGNGITSAQLTSLETSDATIKKTKLSETFDEASFRERYGKDAIILFVIRENGDLAIPAGGTSLALKEGDTLISFVADREGDNAPLPSPDPQGPKTPLP